MFMASGSAGCDGVFSLILRQLIWAPMDLSGVANRLISGVCTEVLCSSVI